MHELTAPHSERSHSAAPLRVPIVQGRSQDRVDQILTVAAQLADEVGLDAFSTSEVARRCGCSIGTVYRLFSDKFGLFDHLASRNTDLIISGMSPYNDSIEAAAETTVSTMRWLPDTIPGYRALGAVDHMHTFARDVWRDVAEVILKTTPSSSASAVVVAAALRGANGILLYGSAPMSSRLELAKCLIVSALSTPSLETQLGE